MNAKAEEITDTIYRGYGSGTGILFGIPLQHRMAVQAIVSATITIMEKTK